MVPGFAIDAERGVLINHHITSDQERHRRVVGIGAVGIVYEAHRGKISCRGSHYRKTAEDQDPVL
jgi:hypothetical protein